MAQIHALTPEGRLPSAAVEHVREIAVPATSGVRDLTSEVEGHTGGRLLYEGTGDKVVLVFDELVVSGGGNLTFPRLSRGTRPRFRVRCQWFASTSPTSQGTVNISGAGYFNVYGVVAGQAMSLRVEYDTDDP